MRAWLVSWILRLLRRLTDWLSRPESPRNGPSVSWEGAPEHWIRRAAPPPPAHWLARVRAAVPLEAVDPASPPPAPAGDVPQIVAPPPQRRRAEPALLAPTRPSSPDAPPAGKGGSSLPRSDAARHLPNPFGMYRATSERPVPARARVITRIEEAVPPQKPRTSGLVPESAARKSSDDFRATPSPRRPFDIVDEGVPAEPVRFRPPAPRAPQPPLRRSFDLPAPAAKQPARSVTESQRAAQRRPAPPSEAFQDRPAAPVPLPSESPPTRDPEAIEQPGPIMASGWPELAVRPPEDDEPWRAAGLDAERRRRLDLEQRGKPWSE